MGGLLLGTAAAAAATAGSGASIALDPSSGLPKTTVTVQVNCGSWNGGWDVSLTAFGVDQTVGHIDSGATSTTPVAVPPDTPAGPTPIVATCTASELVSRPDPTEFGSTDPDPLPKPFTLPATFTVEDVVVAQPATIVTQPDRGRAGASVSVTGDHLPACDPSGWTVVMGGVVQAPKAPDQVESHAVFTVVVPAAAPVGPTEVALDCVGKPVATAAFRVTAPTSPPVQQPPVQQPPAQQPPAQQPPAQQPPAQQPPAQQPSAIQAPAVAVSGSLALPSVGLGVLALAAAGAVLRAQRTKAGREWAQRHVRVVVGAGGSQR